MSHTNTEKIIVVTNEKSTRSDSRDSLVYEPLRDEGIDFTIHPTGSPDFETNVAELMKLPDGATIISAGGDGTASQVINASLRGEKDFKIGLMKLGNFNDQAKERQDDEDTVLDLLDGDEVLTRPLRVEVDGEYWRHAPGYLSIGWAALAAGEFSKPDVRKKIRNTPDFLKLSRSLAHVARHYYANRNDLLTPFTVNGGPVLDQSTDILAINNKRVARVVKTDVDYSTEPYFGLRADINVSRIAPNLSFIRDALKGTAPLEQVEQMHAIFEKAAVLPTQTDGEFQVLEAESVFAFKHPADVVRMLHSKSSS